MAGWEICEIHVKTPKDPRFRMSTNHYVFCAEIAGSDDIAGVSPRFEAGIIAEGPPPSSEAREALNLLRAQLMSDGWQMISQGVYWYNYSFRRAAGLRTNSSNLPLRLKSLMFYEGDEYTNQLRSPFIVPSSPGIRPASFTPG